ncbi:hypothetical protein BD289DRAFT_507124 [Coniella lustricola]|uniref:Histidine kinase group protein n=1 Tax=Coniella lustricola TaxID=2025994 RepID=A0A2T3A3X8_9PEZI|nr:hypothetical protein BD289DRAFT_507124 [Coniella lustricola]
MPKNRKKQKQGLDSDCKGDAPHAPSTAPSTTLNASISSGLPSRPKDKASSTAVPASQGSPALIICRNKHWRYISSFHGPWLQLPPEIIETLAYHNYSHPLPRPIDPAVYYDLLKIRRLVDDATDLAVRAASGLVSLKSLDNSHPGAALGLGPAYGKQPMLSAERRHKLREQATAKLARAYQLDEIACSVATMQGASSLEDVASLVLKRDPHNLDAKYVHFFHEKIPSRQLAESTSLNILDEVIAGQPLDCEALRTRATVRMFKEDYKGAAKDLTEALHILKVHTRHRNTAENQSRELQLASDRNSWRADAVLNEDQQPSSLEAQLLFARAGVLLSIACLSVDKALEPMPSPTARPRASSGTNVNCTDDQIGRGSSETATSTPTAELPPPLLTAGERLAETKILDARKAVKVHARKALRDYMAFLSSLHYSPGFSMPDAMDYNKKIAALKHKGRRPVPTQSNGNGSSGGGAGGDFARAGGERHVHKVYKMNELFVASPPTDLPPYPPPEVSTLSPLPPSHPTTENSNATYITSATIETVTYHPLLTDALHSLLLCHTLVQTSTKELQRHAHMVARICRAVDGYPMFQSSRSPARADWIEILRQCQNWLGLEASWETLCSTASLYPAASPMAGEGSITRQPVAAPQQVRALPPTPTPVSASTSKGTQQQAHNSDWTSEKRKEAIHREAIRRALEDDRVGDQEMFRVAYQTHKRSVEADFKAQREGHLQVVDGDGGNRDAEEDSSTALSTALVPAQPSTNNLNGQLAAPTQQPPPSPSASHRMWSQDEGREYPILTQRASAVARWQREAPSQGWSSININNNNNKSNSAPLAASSLPASSAAGPPGVSPPKKKKKAVSAAGAVNADGPASPPPLSLLSLSSAGPSAVPPTATAVPTTATTATSSPLSLSVGM